MKKVKYFLWAISLIMIAIIVLLLVKFDAIKTVSITNSSGIIQRFEKTGKLQVITYYMDQVLDEEEKKYLFDFDILYPDTKVLLSVKTEASACIDLTKVTKDKIKITANEIELTLPEPEFCSDPIIDLDSVKKHLESGFGAADLQLKALQNGKELARNQAKENKIFDLAKQQGELMIIGLLGGISDKKITIKYQ